MKRLAILCFIVGFALNIYGQSFGSQVIENNSFRFIPSYGDLLMRRYIAGDMVWKRALVPTADQLIINLASDFSNGVEIQGNKVFVVGKLGIGNENPSALLEIRSAANTASELHINSGSDNGHSVVRFQDAGENDWGLISNYPSIGKFCLYNYQSTAFPYALVVDRNSNIGIGTVSPSFKFHVNSNTNGWASKTENQGVAVFSAYGNGTNGGYGQHIRVDNSRQDRYALHVYDGTNDLLYVRNDGNIGIGTRTPATKLDVAGTIKAQEIQVTLASMNNLNLKGTLVANNINVKANGNTADFVFADDYELTELDDVETFIKENKHLSAIPSAQTMEEQGVNLAEMNKLLLLKIEELTLYTIEKHKEVQELKADRKKETGEREALEERLAKIEALLLGNDPE